jgi:F-type H+-transporting ATPase subunit epsilon
MSDKIHLEIVTPLGRVLDTSVDEVTAPSVDGEFGILPGHLPLLAALKTGIVTYRQGSESTRVAVGPGFAEAGPDKLVILTEEYAERPQIDPVVVRRDLAEAQQELAKLENVPIVSIEARGGAPAEIDARLQRQALIDRENWMATQLDLYGDPPPATQRPFEAYGAVPPPAEDEVPQASE